MEVLFATSNQHKVAEANKVGAEFKMTFTQVNVMYPEVRADSVRAVAEEGVRYVYNQIRRPIIVEDSGIFIEALNGFPGPYSGFFHNKVGNAGLLKLLDGVEDRKAQFISAIGYCDKDKVEVFEGVVDGYITFEERGKGGFGYDPVFLPADSTKTFAEDIKHKNLISHRRKSTELLCQYLKKGTG
jgi:XTP/dITP diphosphohydrolase